MGRRCFDRRSLRTAGRGSLLLATLLLAACSGGGGDGGDDPLPCTTLVFDRALMNIAAGDVYLEAASATCSTIGVSVVINNLDRIYTVGFDVTFPAGLLNYDSYTLGPLMQKGSPTFPPQVILSESAGALNVIVSRFGSDPPVNAVGSEGLITFRFSRVAAGGGIIDFDVSGSSAQTEVVKDEVGGTASATFAPGHGGLVTVP